MLRYIRPIALWILLSGIYFLSAKFGLSLAFEQANTSPVWPPTGIAIAALLYFGWRVWPGIFLGTLVVNLSTGLALPLSLSVGLGNAFEALCAYYLITRLACSYPFNSVIEVTKFTAIIFIASLSSALIGVMTLKLGGLITWQDFSLLFSTWWLGDVVGGLVVTPFLLTWSKPFKSNWPVRRVLQAILFACLSLFFFSVVFSGNSILGRAQYPLAFVYLPLAILIAYYFLQHGSTLFILTVSGFAIYGTLHGYGPFVRASANESLLLLQGFMGVTMVTSLILAASVSERKKAKKESEISRLNLELLIAQQSDDLDSATKELKLAESVFRDSIESILITDKTGLILRVNPAFTKITGYSAGEVIGKNPRILNSGQHDAAFFDKFWQSLLTKHSWQGELWNKSKTGHIFPVSQTVTAVKDKNNEVIHYISIFNDITERKATEERIHHLAHFDILTGLHNRLSFNGQLKNAIARAKRANKKMAILYLDLDNFKVINDASGHSVGDLLLKSVANRLKIVLRDEDTIARLGGDEFVILLPNIEQGQSAGSVADKILFVMNKPILLESTELVVTCSMGISIFPENGDNADTLLKNADVAMYRAKDTGRNMFQFFNNDMNTQAHERLLLLSDLRKALENDEFILHYQAQIDIHSGKILGCEALIRWHHAQKGMIPPNKFISIAEDSGLIKEIGNWVIREACTQQQRWYKAGLPELQMAVNLSGRQFSNQQLIHEIKRIIDDTGIKPKHLELELTESTIMENVDENIETLQQLKEMGVQLAIDDFGTGYSSMAYLKRFPINRLKVDQSFVRDIVDDADNTVIVNAIISLGHNLHMNVIAEGVETIEQLTFLKQNGCDMVQGYYFSKPIIASEFETLFLKQQDLKSTG